MDTVQAPSTPTPTPPTSRGIFGTSIPTSIAFGLAVVLFFMPFVDMKCNNITVKEISGFQLATGFSYDKQQNNNSIFGNTETTVQAQGDKEKPNNYAIAAMVLGVLGLVFSLLKFREHAMACAVTGALGVVAMIALMIDVKRLVRINLGDHKINDGGLNMNFGGSVDVLNADFTGAFYFTVLLFVLGAVFSWMQRKG